MKKLICILLAALLVFGLCACGGEKKSSGAEIISHKDDKDPEPKKDPEPEKQPQDEEVFSFVFNGVSLTPGSPFTTDGLPPADSFYSVPSCAVEGTDNVYQYGSLEITSVTDKSGEFLYSVYFIEPSVKTPEGLGLGDPVSKADSLYKTEFKAAYGGRVYTLGETSLNLVIENDVITGIEYLWAIGE